MLGEYPTIGLAAARIRADRMRGIVSDGGNPQRDLTRREAPTLGDLIERYLKEEVVRRKSRGRSSFIPIIFAAKFGRSFARRKRTTSRLRTSTGCIVAWAKGKEYREFGS